MISEKSKVFKPLSSDMMEVLSRVETDFSLYDIRIRGIPLWSLLRIRWFFSEWARLYTVKESAKLPRTRLYRLWLQLKPWLQRLSDWRVLLPTVFEGHHRTDIVFFSDGISFVNLEGTWYERFCDPLIEQGKELKLSSVLWSPVDVEKSPTKTSIFSFQPKIALLTLLGALQAKIFRSGVDELEGPRTVIESMGYEARQLTFPKVLTCAYRVSRLQAMFISRLARVKPRLAFVVNYYSLEGMSFVWACKHLAIPVVDLQHGVQGEYHPAYAGWSPDVSDRGGLEFVPDYFWVWSDNEADPIRKCSGSVRHQPYVGGNPWTAVWQNDTSGSPVITRILERVKAIKARASERPVILVTLQYGLSYEEQLKPLRELLGLMHEYCCFWVRLHPMMLERREEVRNYLGEHSFELDEISDLPLQALLPFCDFHITHSSSTVIEAADYGIPSLITSAFGAELFPAQLGTGIATFVEGNVQQMSDIIRDLVKNKKADQNRELTAETDTLAGLLRVAGILQSGVST